MQIRGAPSRQTEAPRGRVQRAPPRAWAIWAYFPLTPRLCRQAKALGSQGLRRPPDARKRAPPARIRALGARKRADLWSAEGLWESRLGRKKERGRAPPCPARAATRLRSAAFSQRSVLFLFPRPAALVSVFRDQFPGRPGPASPRRPGSPIPGALGSVRRTRDPFFPLSPPVRALWPPSGRRRRLQTRPSSQAHCRTAILAAPQTCEETRLATPRTSNEEELAPPRAADAARLGASDGGPAPVAPPGYGREALLGLHHRPRGRVRAGPTPERRGGRRPRGAHDRDR